MAKSCKPGAIDVEFEPSIPNESNTLNIFSPLDASLSLEPELSKATFEFIDSQSPKKRSIECRMAFMIEKDGVTTTLEPQ